MRYQNGLKCIYLKPENFSANTKKKFNAVKHYVFALELDLLLEDFIDVLK